VINGLELNFLWRGLTTDGTENAKKFRLEILSFSFKYSFGMQLFGLEHFMKGSTTKDTKNTKSDQWLGIELFMARFNH